jgi:hypothetical protein
MQTVMHEMNDQEARDMMQKNSGQIWCMILETNGDWRSSV